MEIVIVGPFIGLLLMLGLVGYTIDRGLIRVANELKRIADALEGKEPDQGSE